MAINAMRVSAGDALAALDAGWRAQSAGRLTASWMLHGRPGVPSFFLSSLPSHCPPFFFFFFLPCCVLLVLIAFPSLFFIIIIIIVSIMIIGLFIIIDIFYSYFVFSILPAFFSCIFCLFSFLNYSYIFYRTSISFLT